MINILKQIQNNLKKVYIIFFIAFTLFSCLLIFHEKFIYQNIYNFKIYGIDYNKFCQDPLIAVPKEYIVKQFKDKKLLTKFDISMDFKVEGYNIHDNLFQTADYNNGVRLEFNEVYLPTLLYNENGNLHGISLEDKDFHAEPNVTYNLKVSFVNNKYITARISYGKKLGVFRINKLNIKNFDSVVNKITLGTGFSPERSFTGEISNASINYNVLKFSPIRLIIFILCELILAVISIISAFSIFKNRLCINDKKKTDLTQLFILNGIIIYYPTFIYLKNLFEMNFCEYLCLCAVLCAVFTTLFLLLGRFFKNRNSLMIILLLLYFFIFFSGATIKNSISKDPLYLLLYLFIAASVFVIFIDIKDMFKKLLQYFVLVLFITMFISSTNNIINYIKLQFSNDGSTKQEVTTQRKDLPNFYVIIPDAYMNTNYLKNYLDFDNSEFINFLKDKGFYIAENSRSNYAFTWQSLPSIVNYSYLQDLNFKNTLQPTNYVLQVSKLYKESKLFELFKNNGFETFFINSNALICQKPNNIDHIFLNNSIFTSSISISKEILEKSILNFNNYNVYIQQHKEVTNAFKVLKNIVNKKDNGQKRFIFAHILAPHYPFAVDKDGNQVRRVPFTTKFQESHIATLLNKEAFIDQSLYVNSQLKTVIDSILKNDKNAVILITSDHTISAYFNSKINGSKGMKDDFENIHQRFANFIAVYTYDKNYGKFYSSMTPVSALRLILNQYYGTNLEIQKDKIYLTTDSVIYDPEDVTDLVTKHNSGRVKK